MDEPLRFRWRRRAYCAALGLTLLFPHAGRAAEPAAEADAPGAVGPEEPAKSSPKAPPSAPAQEVVDDEALAAEEEAAAEESERLQRRPAPKGRAVVWGRVTDTKFDEAVVEAQVAVTGSKQKIYTDLEGRFRLELAPGTHQLRASYELHQASRVEVVLKAGDVTEVTFKLVPDEGAVQEVVIEEEADHASQEGQALERKRSGAVGDGLGRAEIARSPDRNAAEAAQRVVGATIVDGRFVFVRGLGERYTNALLNGSPLPSTEPDRNTVPLDLFPALVLDGLTITKQFLPDMPADFAGGSVAIKTRDFPRQPLLQLSLNVAYNSEATFQKRPGYTGSRTDWAGFDGGRRSFPDGIPDRRLDQASTTTAEQIRYGHRFNTPFATFLKATPPNFGASLVTGNSYKLGESAKLGVIFALNYGHSYQLQHLMQRRIKYLPFAGGGEQLGPTDEYRGERGVDSVRWGAFTTAALELSRRHTLSLVAFRSQNADDGTWDLQSADDRYHTVHLEYVSRALNFVQLRGEHRFPFLNDLTIGWHGSLALADRDQPDTRDVRYERALRDGVPGFSLIPDGSGQHSFLSQSDTTVNGGLNIEQPLIRAEAHATKLKVGTLVSSRRRSFEARRFQLIVDRPGPLYEQLKFCPGERWSGGCPNYVFRPELVRADGLLLNEWTLDFDEYETGLDVYAGYLMVDAKLLPKLRAVGGVRAEITYQTFEGYDPFDRSSAARSKIYETDWLPAVSLIYELTKLTNLRAGASKTLARPQLRELSPAISTTSAGDVTVQGNPGLQMTKVTNLDLRYEYFPTLREVLAVSVFYKHFERPIEETIGSSSVLGFTNADSAMLVGAEFEAKQSLAVLLDGLRDFSAQVNLTFVHSSVDLGSNRASASSSERPLSYQSPYVVNLAFDYSNQPLGVDVRLLYNVYGPRITAVGADGLPNTYEQPRHLLDLSASKKVGSHFEFKFQAQNLLFSPIVFGYRNTQAYRASADGTRFESLGRNPELKRYSPGATFTGTATYSY